MKITNTAQTSSNHQMSSSFVSINLPDFWHNSCGIRELGTSSTMYNYTWHCVQFNMYLPIFIICFPAWAPTEKIQGGQNLRTYAPQPKFYRFKQLGKQLKIHLLSRFSKWIYVFFVFNSFYLSLPSWRMAISNVYRKLPMDNSES